MPEPFVTCRALSKTYRTPSGGIEALRSVDATLALGEITALVGPSGSGKSTLLRALAGLDRPDRGSLRIGGTELANASPRALRHHRGEVATYVSQKAADNFIPHLTLREQADQPKAQPLLEAFGLAHRLDVRPTTLSGGEQARAAFALALARETPLLISDEPSAELDRGTVGPLLEAIRSHAREGTAFIVATHDPDVVAFADRIIHLDHGQIVEHADLSDLVQHHAVGEGERAAVAASDPALAMQAVRKSYQQGSQRIDAVRDATFQLDKGAVGALIGRSGSGKSTLLTLLAGLQRPDDGEIVYASGGAADELRWDELAFLPQRFGLLPELTVRENIEYAAQLAGTLEAHRPTIEGLLEGLGLTELADRTPPETSIGQQQRTALARALSLRPAVLLADEPTSHQDSGWRDRVWQLLVQQAENGTSCLIATHEPAVTRYATQTWEVSEGTIQAFAADT